MRTQKEIYLPEIERFVKAVTGADKVITYRPTVRHSQVKQGEKLQPPASDVHSDLTPGAAAHQARIFLPPEDKDYQYSRALHLSCWRTFSQPPQDWPLGVWSASSVRESDGLVNSVIWQDEIPDLQNLPPLPKEIKSEALIYLYKDEF